ncbi:class I SAM-dependent methyltransferase [Yoonia sp. 67-2]|nr:class I SAM-dependent methyltransferase [Yoonia sp. 67-2]
MKYTTFMAALHRDVLFDWYMEIGCRTGRIFANARGKTIAVDPFFRCDTNVIGSKPALHVFQQTSDDFFASDFLKAMKVKLSFSFLDGMHLFEFLLRDFMAAEKASDPKGVIALHDCCPFSHEMTTRDLSAMPKQAWTGDVWKLIPILKHYRPDLQITVLDAAPTGLVLISKLDPQSQVLERNYAEIVECYTTTTLQEFGLDAFNALFDYEVTSTFIAAGYPLFSDVRLPEAAALKPEKITP